MGRGGAPEGSGGARLNSATAFATFRSFPSDGEFTIWPRTTMVVEPPPSRFIASVHPRSTKSCPNSASVMPLLYPGWRPSTVTRTTSVPRTPTPVRGWRVVAKLSRKRSWRCSDDHAAPSHQPRAAAHGETKLAHLGLDAQPHGDLGRLPSGSAARRRPRRWRPARRLAAGWARVADSGPTRHRGRDLAARGERPGQISQHDLAGDPLGARLLPEPRREQRQLRALGRAVHHRDRVAQLVRSEQPGVGLNESIPARPSFVR